MGFGAAMFLKEVLTAAVSEVARLRSEFLKVDGGKVQQPLFPMRLISFLLNDKDIFIVPRSQFSDDVILTNWVVCLTRYTRV